MTTKSVVKECKSNISNIQLNNSLISFSSFIKNLGITFDENLTFDKHIKNVSNTTMYRLRQLRHIRPHFDKSSFKIIIHSTITSRLDFCNSLLSGSYLNSTYPLQLVQNFAARLILNRNKFCHITPLLHELHWLPIQPRIKFKIFLLIYKSLHGLAPSYLSNLLHPKEPSMNLRSSNSNILAIPKSKKPNGFFTRTMGDRAFSVYGPTEWNKLPEEIKSSSSLNLFKKSLKTYLFSNHFENFNFQNS